MRKDAKTRVCRVCKKRKPISTFYLFNAKLGLRRKSCGACKYVISPKRKLTSAEIREKNLRWLYKITGVEWSARFEKQGKRCAICRSKRPSGKKGWATDHSHATGEFRGVLCSRCNLLLAYCLESIKILKAAIRYIQRHS